MCAMRATSRIHASGVVTDRANRYDAVESGTRISGPQNRRPSAAAPAGRWRRCVSGGTAVRILSSRARNRGRGTTGCARDGYRVLVPRCAHPQSGRVHSAPWGAARNALLDIMWIIGETVNCGNAAGSVDSSQAPPSVTSSLSQRSRVHAPRASSVVAPRRQFLRRLFRSPAGSHRRAPLPFGGHQVVIASNRRSAPPSADRHPTSVRLGAAGSPRRRSPGPPGAPR